MSRRLAEWALGLYPSAFRRRYGEEMRALLDDTPLGARSLVDLLRGAMLAHLRPSGPAAASISPIEAVRAHTTGVLGGWVLFVLAGLGYYKTTEDGPYTAAGHAHPLLGGAHAAIQALAAIGGFAALPLVVVALSHAREDRGLRRVMSPVRVTLNRGRLQGALVCGMLVAAAMATMTLATGAYVAALMSDTSSLATAPNGPGGLVSTRASLITQLVVMLAATALAIIALVRGWRAARQLGPSASLG